MISRVLLHHDDGGGASGKGHNNGGMDGTTKSCSAAISAMLLGVIYDFCSSHIREICLYRLDEISKPKCIHLHLRNRSMAIIAFAGLLMKI